MLRIKNLKLLNDKLINFQIDDDQAFVLKGSNGCGKSLFLKSLARLCPANYEIFLFMGKDVNSWSPEVYRSQVLYVSTSPLLVKDETVETFFTSVLGLAIYKNHVSDFDYKSYLQKWNISSVSVVSQLSSGQKQMISILRALTLKARILLLDEPTANLDLERTLEIEDLLVDWKKRTQGSLVIISHSREQMHRLNFPCIDFSSIVRPIAASIN